MMRKGSVERWKPFVLLVTGLCLFVSARPVSSAGEPLQSGSIRGTGWDVVVIQAWNGSVSVKGATVEFSATEAVQGTGLIEWDDPSIEGLPFTFTEETSRGNATVFRILVDPFAVAVGKGIARSGAWIGMVIRAAEGRKLVYVILGVPLVEVLE
jgi:hypothetical protein